jgi:hypothetical protein
VQFLQYAREITRKGPDSESTARRMLQNKMHLEFNMGRDNRVARKQLQPKNQRVKASRNKGQLPEGAVTFEDE